MVSYFLADSIDGAGHNSHWGSDLYYKMVAQKALQVQNLLETLENTTTESGNPNIRLTYRNDIKNIC